MLLIIHFDVMRGVYSVVHYDMLFILSIVMITQSDFFSVAYAKMKQTARWAAAIVLYNSYLS
jgi:hypothetical protein